MRAISSFENLYIHKDAVDMRKSINGLSCIVSEEMGLDLSSSSLFIFCNKPRTHMKILYFDHSGFALWLKRLDKSKFAWPFKYEERTISISHADMNLLFEGINVWTRFEKIHFECIV